ncbi:putative mediator of RNA polymerase II transcription subunit 26b [Drosera capensis]
MAAAVVIDHWREFFSSANCGIFDIIEKAIMVAACDHPNELRSKRDSLAELLFTCNPTRRCNRCDLDVDDDGDGDGGGGVIKSEVDGVHTKESKSNSCGGGGDDGHVEMMKGNQMSKYDSYGDAEIEALNDEIDEENRIVGEVFRIKEVLLNFENESDSVLYDSLRRLQLLELNVDILKTTEIGKAVKCLRKSPSQRIFHLTKELIEGWKIMVDEWVKTAEAFTESTPESVNPSVVDDEEGLPSPPLDEGAFNSLQGIELSQIFEDMDDDGNPRSNGNREGGRNPPIPKQNVVPTRREQSSNGGSLNIKEIRDHQMKKQEGVAKPLKASSAQFGPGRPVNANSMLRAGNEVKVQQKSDKLAMQRRPPPQVANLGSAGDDAVKLKLEASKRKLHESYQQAENAKKQRTIQVMEVHDLPKQGLGPKNFHGRFGNHNRQWANGRR